MTDIYVETCTIHDDIHLTHHDIHISGSDSSSSSSLSSLGGAGESGLLGRSHQRAGGFPLSIKNDNRFIIWRIIGNKLELIEQSLAHKLNGNFKRISFKDATILPRVHLHKSHEIGMNFSVTILFATTSRLYRIVLPFNKNEHSNTSILSNLCSSDFTNVDASNTFALNLSHVEQPADILVSSRGDALFAFVMPNSAVCCVQMPPSTTQVSSSGRPLMSTQNSGPTLPFKFEINQPTLVKRLWSGLKRGSTAGSLGSSGGLAGSGLSGNENQFASFRLFQLEQSLYLISLCKDFKLKIWCIKSNQCVHTEDMIKYIQFDGDIIWDECQVELLSLPDNCKTSIIISTSDRVKICNLNIELNENIFTINEISRREVIKSGELINVQTTRFNAWLTFKTENESTQVKAVPIGSDDDRNRPNDIIVVDGSQRLANKANQRAKKTRSRRNIANDDSDENIEDDDDEAENDDDEDEDEIDDEERIFIDPGFSDLDVKELYLKLIFEPYRFSKSNMIKSLGILGQNVSANENSSRLISASKSVDEIKELVVRSIEQAVQTHPSYANCGEEEFLSLNVKYWSKYYTMLKQYDYDSRLALGFFADPHNESVVIMIRKNALSFYGKADLSQYYHIVPIEYVQTTFADYFTTDEDTSESESNTTDLFLVFKLLKTINDHVLNSSVPASSDSSRTGKLQYISSLAHELIISNASFLSEFSKYFAEINNTDELTSKLTVLLELFDVEKTRKRLDYLNRTLDSDGDEDDQDNMETDSSIRLSITSDITIDSVLASLKELISKRCEFFRNICVLLTIISSYYETLNISSQVANDLFQKHFESCLNYSNSFEYLKWLCEIYPTSIDKNNLKNSIKRTFDLLDNFQCEQLKSSKDFNQLLLKTFLQSFARFSIPSDSNYQLSLKNYSQLSIYLLANILHAIWPMNLEESFSLIRFFIQNIQYIHLNNYCMQTKWWPTGKNLRLFLLGNCCLFFNNIDQSITYFLRASFNLDKDRCLTKFMGIESASSSHARQSIAANNRRSILINKRTAEKFSQMKRESIFFSSSSHHGDALFSIDSENQLLLDYYTRCIHYYDLNGNVEAAIELIQTALDQSQFDARCKSKLYGVLFKSYMDLEDYERAHTALMSNTDREWKKHSLKHFCTELCKQRRSDLLVGLDYGDMLVELLAFLYKRAQNTDLKTEHGDYYYRVLYAIYVKSKDYRRAAFCMYECSQRLRREINGIESLKRQEKCLLACLNLLKSVDKKLSWLAVLSPDPSTLSASSSSADIAALETRLRLLNNLMSTDTTAEQQAFNDQLVDSNLNVEIVDFDEINRNYMLVHYMIKLSSIMSNQSSIASFYSADEIIGLLVKYSLFDDAIALCLAFKPLESSPLVNIITGLVDRCCDLNSTNALKALSSNDTNNGAIGELTIEYDILKYNESLPAPISPYENPCSFKWKLLHSYLEKFKNVVYYKATCKRLLTLNYEIPSNIIASFKRLNSNALLQIYVNYGLWSEAAELISEYINAILVDEAATKFGTKDSLTPSQLSSQVLLPYAVIDSLLKYLSTGGDDIKEVDLELKKKINEYLYQVKSASESKIKLIGSSRH